MSKVFFTSDTHFGHERAAQWRGIASVEEMDEEIIRKWNETIGKGDTVYHLGDVSFHDQEQTEKILRRLNGSIHLIQGNHDDERNIKRVRGFASLRDVRYLRLALPSGVVQRIMACHYPMVTWRNSHYGSWMLHGHCHGNLDEGRLPEAKRLDVGVDTNGLYPYSLDDVNEIMAGRGFDQVDHHRWHPERTEGGEAGNKVR